VYVLVVSLNLLYTPHLGVRAAFAASDKAPRVYLFGFAPDGDKTPLELSGMTEVQFKDQLAGETKIEYISPKDARAMLKGKPQAAPTQGIEGDEASLKRAQKYLRLAEDAVEEEEYEDLAQTAERAVKYFQKAANQIKDFDEVRDAYVYWAAGLESEGEDGGEKYLNVLAFDDGYTPPKSVKSLLKKSISAAEDAGKNVSLKIVTDPEDVTVWVNGRKMDAPVNEKGLAPGDYIVRVTAKGYKPYTGIAKFSSNKESLEIVLASESGETEDDGEAKMEVFKRLNVSAKEQNYDKQFFDDADQFGGWIKADYLVFGAFKTKGEKSDFYPLVFDVKSGKLGKVGKTAFDHSMEDAEESVDLAYKDTKRAILKEFPEEMIPVGGAIGAGAMLAAAPAPEPEPEPEPSQEEEMYPAAAPAAKSLNLDTDENMYFSDDDLAKAQQDQEQGEISIAKEEKTPFYKQWWFWTIIGAAVVGGGVTAGVLLQPEDQSQSSRLNLPAR